MKRILCLFLSLLLLLGAAAPVLAEKSLRGVPAERGVALPLKNGASRTVYFFPVPGGYYDAKQGPVDALEVPSVAGLRAKSSKSWLQVAQAELGFRWGVTQVNATQKTRTATLTLTGSGYKSTLKVKQLGADRITAMKRKKNQVTVTVKRSNSPAHAYTVLRMKLKGGKPNEATTKVVAEGLLTGSKLTYTVKKGYAYAVYVGPALNPLADGTVYSCDTAMATISVKKVTGSQKADLIQQLGSDGKLR